LAAAAAAAVVYGQNVKVQDRKNIYSYYYCQFCFTGSLFQYTLGNARSPKHKVLWIFGVNCSTPNHRCHKVLKS